MRLGEGFEAFAGGLHRDLLADGLRDGRVQVEPVPCLPAEVVLGSVGQRHGRGSQGVPACALDEVLGQLPDRVIRPVGFVGLQGGELGRMRRIRPFVAEIPVDLEDAVDAADHRALQMQLRGDAQVEVLVIGVDVRLEGAGRRPAVDRLEHGGLDLRVAALVEVGAQRLHDPGAQPHHVPGGWAHDEVEVPHAHARLFGEGDVLALGIPVHLGQGADGLRGDPPGVGEHGELPALGRPDVAFDEQVVAQVDVGLEAREGALPHVRLGEQDLDAVARAVLEGGEGDLPAAAGEHDAARYAEIHVGELLARPEARVGRSYLGDRRGHGELDRVGLQPFVDHPLAFG